MEFLVIFHVVKVLLETLFLPCNSCSRNTDINEINRYRNSQNEDIAIHKIKISRREGLARRLIFGPEAQGGREGTAAKIHTATTLTRKMMSALQNLGVFAELILGP